MIDLDINHLLPDMYDDIRLICDYLKEGGAIIEINSPRSAHVCWVVSGADCDDRWVIGAINFDDKARIDYRKWGGGEWNEGLRVDLHHPDSLHHLGEYVWAHIKEHTMKKEA